MTDSIEIQIADKVLTRINAGTYEYSEPVVAVRHYQPVYTVETAALIVRVIPGTKNQTDDDRDGSRYDITINIGVQKRISGVTNAQLDPLLRLLEQIEDQLRGFNFGVDDFQVGFQGFEDTPLFEIDRLEMPREFGALRSARYWAHRDFE